MYNRYLHLQFICRVCQIWTIQYLGHTWNAEVHYWEDMVGMSKHFKPKLSTPKLPINKIAIFVVITKDGTPHWYVRIVRSFLSTYSYILGNISVGVGMYNIHQPASIITVALLFYYWYQYYKLAKYLFYYCHHRHMHMHFVCST